MKKRYCWVAGIGCVLALLFASVEQGLADINETFTYTGTAFTQGYPNLAQGTAVCGLSISGSFTFTLPQNWQSGTYTINAPTSWSMFTTNGAGAVVAYISNL